MFVGELCDAYLRYAKSCGLQAELIHDAGGHKTLKVVGSGAGRAFRHECGKHCVQRIPETEANGRKQTSIVVVGVLPIHREPDDEPLREADLEITCQTGKQGAGGQNVNKVASAVRMRHRPTGLSVFINGRDQSKNKEEARRILTQRVNDQRRAKVNAEYASLRRERMGDGGRSDKIRTYNFMEGRVVDHRLGTKTQNVKAVMKGDFSLLFNG